MGKNRAPIGPQATENRGFRFLKATMAVGAGYDAVVGVWVLLAPARLAALLGLAMPAEQVYLRFLGVFLLILAGFYLAPAVQPVRYLANVAVAVAGRSMGAAFLLGYVFLFRGEGVFGLLGAIDLLFALLHAAALGPAGRAAMRGSLRPAGSNR